jgi:hypothetical protein
MFETRLFTVRERLQWHEVLDRCAIKDVNWLPEYLKIFEHESNPESFMSFGGKGHLFFYGDEQNFIIYPFFKRGVSDLKGCEGFGHLYDIVSPYGYGGPLEQLGEESAGPDLWAGFYRNFDDYCRQNNIVSEFCRLHPLYENHVQASQFSSGTVECAGEVVYVDLSFSPEHILAEMIHGHRRHIKRAAENADLKFSMQKQAGDDRAFYEMYTHTMLRNGANKKYFFSHDFFHAAFENLGDALRLWKVNNKDEAVSVWIILRHGDVAYAWLSGNNEQYFKLFPTNLLVYRTILQLKGEGCKYLLMGGGKSALRDTVFQYKLGFSNLVKKFYIYKKVHLEKEYQCLAASRVPAAVKMTGFFPQYRAEEDLEAERVKSEETGKGNV